MTADVVIVTLCAVVVGALLKSVSGVGLPFVTIPVVSYVAGIETAVAVTALPNLALNAALAWRERASFPETRDLPVLAATGLVGGVVGTLALVAAPEEQLVALLVLIVVAYATLHLTNPDLRISERSQRRFAPAVGTLAGALQGAIGISGPVVVTWIHSYRLRRNAQVLAVTTLFVFAGLAQLPTLVIGGRMTGLWLAALIACVPALATVPFGERIRASLSSEGFDRLVILTLVGSVAGLAMRTFT